MECYYLKATAALGQQPASRYYKYYSGLLFINISKQIQRQQYVEMTFPKKATLLFPFSFDYYYSHLKHIRNWDEMSDFPVSRVKQNHKSNEI